VKKAYHFLSGEERQHVAEAVTRAELTTSGEIVVLIVERSKSHWHLHMTKSQAVHRRAEREFLKLGIQQTKDRTGVLIMVSVKERMVVIKADRDIHLKVPDGTWDEVVRLINTHIRAGRACRGLCEGVERVGCIMAAYFPPNARDINELPNKAIEKG
jgi:uncharacterized membrane protein